MRFYNHNPRGRNADDCVVRAIATAEGKSWVEIYDALTTIGREMCRMPNEAEVFAKYLRDYQTLPALIPSGGKKRKRVKVKDLPKTGKFIVRVVEHLTLVVDGELVDTWDCSEMYVYKIWKVR